MAGHAATLGDAVVRRAMAVCGAVDATARLSSMTADEHGTTCVRMRCGDACATPALQTALQNAAPLARASVVESVLDGYVEVALAVPSRAEERRRARACIAKRRLPAYLIVLAWALVLAAVIERLAVVRLRWLQDSVGGEKDEV